MSEKRKGHLDPKQCEFYQRAKEKNKEIKAGTLVWQNNLLICYTIVHLYVHVYHMHSYCSCTSANVISISIFICMLLFSALLDLFIIKKYSYCAVH